MSLTSTPAMTLLAPLLAMSAYLVLAWLARPGRQSIAPELDDALATAPNKHIGILALTAWAMHALSIALPLLQTPARFGFAPALSVTAWLVLTVYLVESRLKPQLTAQWVLAGLGALAVGLGSVFAGIEHRMERGWLSLHWALGLAAYGLFAAAVVHAWLIRRAEAAMREASGRSEGMPLLALERLMFRFLWAGFVLLSATLAAGWWLAEQSFGARLDHKTVFSLLAWLTFAALLVGKVQLGWRGLRATRMVYAGSALLLLAYVGSRFVLEVILKRT